MTRPRRGAVAIAGASIALLIAAFPAAAQQQKAPTESEMKSKGAKQLTGAEIRATHIGNTIYHMDVRSGGVAPVYFRDERNRTVVTFPGGSRRNTVWWIEGDRRCEERASRQGLVCSRIYRFEGQLRACLEGDAACFWILREVRGNPENL